MKDLFKDEMKMVKGGLMAPISTICGDGDATAHCFWDHGACLHSAKGYCPSGSEADCDMYCVRPNGTTYYPGNC